MAAGQIKKTQIQAEQTIFALDIGTRSIIGMVGTVENEKVRIVAIEKEEHTERAMIDGQIENIDKVATLAGKVKQGLGSSCISSWNAYVLQQQVGHSGPSVRSLRWNFPGRS